MRLPKRSSRQILIVKAWYILILLFLPTILAVPASLKKRQLFNPSIFRQWLITAFGEGYVGNALSTSLANESELGINSTNITITDILTSSSTVFSTIHPTAPTGTLTSISTSTDKTQFTGQHGSSTSISSTSHTTQTQISGTSFTIVTQTIQVIITPTFVTISATTDSLKGFPSLFPISDNSTSQQTEANTLSVTTSLLDSTVSSSTNSTSVPNTNVNISTQDHTGVAVGSTIAGVAALCVIIFVGFTLKKRSIYLKDRTTLSRVDHDEVDPSEIQHSTEIKQPTRNGGWRHFGFQSSKPPSSSTRLDLPCYEPNSAAAAWWSAAAAAAKANINSKQEKNTSAVDDAISIGDLSTDPNCPKTPSTLLGLGRKMSMAIIPRRTSKPNISRPRSISVAGTSADPFRSTLDYHHVRR